MGFTPHVRGDFSGESWSAGFAQAHRKLAGEYAFTAWKGVAWGDLYRTYGPAMRAAEQVQDREAFYLALHDYLFAVDDGHLSLPRGASNAALIDGLIGRQTGGGFGLGLARLDDGGPLQRPCERAGPRRWRAFVPAPTSCPGTGSRSIRPRRR